MRLPLFFPCRPSPSHPHRQAIQMRTVLGRQVEADLLHGKALDVRIEIVAVRDVLRASGCGFRGRPAPPTDPPPSCDA